MFSDESIYFEKILTGESCPVCNAGVYLGSLDYGICSAEEEHRFSRCGTSFELITKPQFKLCRSCGLKSLASQNLLHFKTASSSFTKFTESDWEEFRNCFANEENACPRCFSSVNFIL